MIRCLQDLLTVTFFGGCAYHADMTRQNGHDPQCKEGGGSWPKETQHGRRAGIVPSACPSRKTPTESDPRSHEPTGCRKFGSVLFSRTGPGHVSCLPAAGAGWTVWVPARPTTSAIPGPISPFRELGGVAMVPPLQVAGDTLGCKRQTRAITSRRNRWRRPPDLGRSRGRIPHSDGKPMAETDVHRQDMVDVIRAPGALRGRSERVRLGQLAALL